MEAKFSEEESGGGREKGEGYGRKSTTAARGSLPLCETSFSYQATIGLAQPRLPPYLSILVTKTTIHLARSSTSIPNETSFDFRIFGFLSRRRRPCLLPSQPSNHHVLLSLPTTSSSSEPFLLLVRRHSPPYGSQQSRTFFVSAVGDDDVRRRECGSV